MEKQRRRWGLATMLAIAVAAVTAVVYSARSTETPDGASNPRSGPALGVHAADPEAARGERVSVEMPPPEGGAALPAPSHRGNPSIVCTVINEEKSPIEGATVIIETSESHLRRLDGDFAASSKSAPGRTDSAGRFIASGLAAGAYHITCRTSYSDIARKVVTVDAGVTAEVTVCLSPGVTIKGTARLMNGTPASHASIACFYTKPSNSTLKSPPRRGQNKLPSGTTASDGSFQLRGAPTGKLVLWASEWHLPSADGFQVATASALDNLEGRAGDVVEWNPVLVPVNSVRLRIVQSDGDIPRHALAVYAIADSWGDLQEFLVDSVPQKSGDSSEYVLTNMRMVPHTVIVKYARSQGGVGWWTSEGILPLGQQLICTLPPPPSDPEPGFARATFNWTLEEAAKGMYEFHLVNHSSDFQLRPTTTNHAIVEERIAPGRYYLRVSRGRSTLSTRDNLLVESGKVLEIGSVDRVATGGLKVQVLHEGKPVSDARASVGVPPMRTLLQRADDGSLVCDMVACGRTIIMVRAAGLYAKPVDVTISENATTECQIVLRSARRQTIAIQLPAPDRWGRCRIRLVDAEGETVNIHYPVSSDSIGPAPIIWDAEQPDGQFSVEVVLDAREAVKAPIELDGTSALGAVRVAFKL